MYRSLKPKGAQFFSLDDVFCRTQQLLAQCLQFQLLAKEASNPNNFPLQSAVGPACAGSSYVILQWDKGDQRSTELDAVRETLRVQWIHKTGCFIY